MTTRTASWITGLGFLLTFGGVGGIENSLTTPDLLTALAVSVLGLALMWAGTLGIRQGHYYD